MKKIIISLAIILVVPTFVFGTTLSSLVISLIEGKTLPEAVIILANQIDSVINRIETIEQTQISKNTTIDSLVDYNIELNSKQEVLNIKQSNIDLEQLKTKKQQIENETIQNLLKEKQNELDKITTILMIEQGKVKEQQEKNDQKQKELEINQTKIEMKTLENEKIIQKIENDPIPIVTKQLLVEPSFDGTPEWEAISGAQKIKISTFTLQTKGNTGIAISEILISHLFGGATLTNMWIESDEGLFIGNKVETTDMGEIFLPMSFSLTPNETRKFIIYANSKNDRSGIIQTYIEKIISDSYTIEGLPLVGPAINFKKQ